MNCVCEKEKPVKVATLFEAAKRKKQAAVQPVIYTPNLNYYPSAFGTRPENSLYNSPSMR